jgi:hypothetical protein
LSGGVDWAVASEDVTVMVAVCAAAPVIVTLPGAMAQLPPEKPAERAHAPKVTVPVKPLAGAIVTVEVAFVAPGVTPFASVIAVPVMVKSGAATAETVTAVVPDEVT